MSILSDFTMDDLEGLILLNPSLRGFMQGYLAEFSLMKQLASIPVITGIRKIPDRDSQKGDISLLYKGEPVVIEVKSVTTSTVRQNVTTDSWEGTVICKSSDAITVVDNGNGEQRRSCNLRKGGFDILAISTYAATGKWEYVYMENRYLPWVSKDHPDLIKSSFVIDPSASPFVRTNIEDILEEFLISKLKYDNNESNN